MKPRKSDFLSRISPPGLSLKTHGRLFVIGHLVCLLFATSFIGNYYMAYSALYTFKAGKRILIENAVIRPFGELIGNGPFLYLLLAALLLLLSIYHYVCFYRGSRSIYLMKRLPERGEILKRVFVLPLLLALFTLLTAVFLYGICLVAYLVITPDACLPTSWL